MSSKRNITYKCPYCDKRFNKENLVIHVGDKHDDMIPEGYSAFRLVFDYINKKPSGYNGKCIICGKESGWDENKGKYNRICSDPNCKKKYIESFEKRMINAKGVKRISSTAEGQAKMLANRKISGKYKFKDGVEKTYTGTYEKKALEFMDKVMNIRSEDVTTPGPIMEYMFEGKKHIYISDIYYAPYNLIIEVKDGGNNPNMREMKSYRAKQIAKEEYIIKNTNFNYLRLTNNDFSQLLAAFMQLKMEMSSDTPERVIRINEGVIQERSLSGPVILYHGSIDGSYNKILNNSPNIGKNYEPMRTSSFWFKKKEYAEMFATGELLHKFSDKKIDILIDNNMRTLVDEQYKSLVLDIIKNNDCYVYSKLMDGKNVTGGNGRNFPEYTIDFTITPDKVEKVSYNGKLNSIKFTSKDYINKIIEKYKKNTMTFGNSLLGQIKDYIIYPDNQEIRKKRKEMKKYIEESTKITYNNNFNDIKNIADSLSSKELSNICNNGNFTDSPYIIYREILNENNKPAAFIDVYNIPEEMNKNEAAIVVACNPKYRGKGYIYNLVSRAIPKIKELNIRYLYWETDKFNKASSTIAKKFGFKPTKNFSKDDDNYVLDLSNYVIESYIEEASTGLFKKIQKDPEIVETYGFVSSNNIYNENIKIKGFNKWLRGRSELLIVDKDKVYLKKDNKGYSIPGGGWEKDEDHNLSAIRETNEEARIKVKNVSYVGAYASFFEPKDWVKERISEENWWYGEYTELYIGEYDGEFKGHVDKIDQDKAMESGKFYNIKSVYNDLIPVHQEALDNIIDESYIEESKDASAIKDDFKKKSGKTFKLINLTTKEALKYVSDKWRNGKECRLAICKEDDKLAGYVYWNKSGNIAPLEVYKDYRGYGLSETLMKEAIKNGGYKLGVYSDNEVAIRLYKKLGFVETGRKKYKDGDEVIIMELKSSLNEASISNYKFLDIKSNKSKALEYLKANSETKSYAEDTIKNYNGELVIYNDSMIGRILVGDKRDKGFITDFYINEEHRGNKLGSRLLDDAINKYHGIDLLVDKDNNLAIDMYKKRGFVIIKTYKNQYYMKLKSKIKEDTYMTEAMNALMTGYIPGSVDNPNNTYIVNYMQNNVFSEEDPNEDCIGVSDSPLFKNLIIRDKDNVLKKVDESFLKDKTYNVYIVEKSIEEVSKLLAPYMNKEVEFGFLYETMTGKKLYTKDQVGLEGVLIPAMDYYEYMKEFKEICDNYFSAKDKRPVEINEATCIPKEVRHFSKSGLMQTEKVYTLNEYINSKSSKVLECLDIQVKEV